MPDLDTSGIHTTHIVTASYAAHVSTCKVSMGKILDTLRAFGLAIPVYVTSAYAYVTSSYVCDTLRAFGLYPIEFAVYLYKTYI